MTITSPPGQVPSPLAAPKPAKQKGGGFLRYVITRFLLIIPTVFILITVVFFLMRVTGDPITAALGGRLTPDQLAERIHESGYDRPLFIQYFEYLGQIFTGNLGRTLTDNTAVTASCTTMRAKAAPRQ